MKPIFNYCILWKKSLNDCGYGITWCPIRQKRISAHRLAYEIEYGAIPDGLCVCHKCDSPACINANHLFLATHKENMEDKVCKERQYKPLGESHHNTDLTDEDVLDIKQLLSYGYPNIRLAEMYGVDKRTISAIKLRKTWRHI